MAETRRAKWARRANRLLARFGLQLVRRDGVFDMEGVLARAAARGVRPATWIDVGASDGIWTRRAYRHFPDARFLMFEPLAERQAALDLLARRHGFRVVAAAAGAEAGTIEFAVDPELDGSAVAIPGTGRTRVVPVETIDRAIAAHGLRGPFGIKLDTHGHEIPVLTGATQSLGAADLVIIEAYNFTLTPECRRFHELCAWMETRGFRCSDIADPMRRPADGMFWQVDLAFEPATRAAFAHNAYR